MDKSHKPHSKHPNSHIEDEIRKIKKLIKRNPHIGLNELYTKLRTEIAYSRHYAILYRILVKSGFYKEKSTKKKKYIPKPYKTPEYLGQKWQLDVKYVPRSCYTDSVPKDDKYYQYTVIDEASRERFIYPYKKQSSFSTIDFVKRAIIYFGYKPKCIQTDNGFEFKYFRETKRILPFDIFLESLHIEHKLIKPRTPRHNGKVERSHRNDSERFYKFL